MLIFIEDRQTLNTDSQEPSLVRVNSRLTKSLRQLNESITKFDQIYTHHRERVKYPHVLDDNLLEEGLQQTNLGEDIFDNAAVLESWMNKTLNLQAEDEKMRRRFNCLYVAKLLPLVKLLADIGGLAAQVRLSFLHLLVISSGCWVRPCHGCFARSLFNHGSLSSNS